MFHGVAGAPRGHGAVRQAQGTWPGNYVAGAVLLRHLKPWRNRHEVEPFDPNMGATMLSTVLVVLLILLLLGAIPSWPYSRGWGYGPSGILGLVLIVVLILALTGRV